MVENHDSFITVPMQNGRATFCIPTLFCSYTEDFMIQDKTFYLKKLYNGISKRKRVICVLFLIAIIVFIVAGYLQGKDKVTFLNSEFTGITSEGMEQNGEMSAFLNASMKIHSLDVHEDVDISGKIRTADGDVPFRFTGDLYVSEKQNQGIEAYVGKIVDNKNNFVVNYFEIKNDTSYDLLKYSEENVNKRIISLDLERNGSKYYFEVDMEALGVSFHAERITETAPSDIDFYENYVNAEKCVFPCIISYDVEENQMADIGSMQDDFATGECWYYKQVVESWFNGETIYEYYAEPQIHGRISDVGTGGSSNWDIHLQLECQVEKDGVCMDDIGNVFSIQSNANKPMEFQMYVGENTIITTGEFGGICKFNGVEDDYKRQLGGSMDGVVNSYAVYHRYDSVISLDKTSHRISFFGWTSTIDSDLRVNQPTNCVLRWSYHMCYQNKFLEEGSATIEKTVTYIVNMRT